MRFPFTLIGALAIAGCASSQPRQPPAQTPAPTAVEHEPRQGAGPASAQQGMAGQQPGTAGHGGMGGMMCPAQVPGTTAKVTDVEGGVAIEFTTTGDVAELRRRVAHMAEMHGRRGGHPGAGMGHGHGHGAHAAIRAASARTETIDGGARVVLTPADPARLAELRQQVRQQATAMNAEGECPMMQGERPRG